MRFLKKKYLLSQRSSPRVSDFIDAPGSPMMVVGQQIAAMLKPRIWYIVQEPERFAHQVHSQRWLHCLKRHTQEAEHAKLHRHSTIVIWRKKGDVQKLQNTKHINGVSQNGKLRSRLKSQELDNAALPSGPTPQGTSSMRVLPKVHEALCQNDPRVTSFSQPVVKKAPPTLDRARPAAFYSGTDPPRIGSGVQPPPPAAPRPAVVPSVEPPLAATPMTPGHPPRPPLSALPKYPSMETSSGANKHPLEPPTAQAPPSKHVRCKAYPYASQPPDQVYVAASATVEMPQLSRPCPKGSSSKLHAYTPRDCVHADRLL